MASGLWQSNDPDDGREPPKIDTSALSCPAFSGLANLRLSYAVAFISRSSSMASCGVRYPSAEWRRFRL
jgi:hypothetical protein